MLALVHQASSQAGNCDASDHSCSSGLVLQTASDVTMVSGMVQSFVFVDSEKRPGKRYRKSLMVTESEVPTRTQLDASIWITCAYKPVPKDLVHVS